MKELVEKELERLVQQGELVQVRHSEWDTPIVIVQRKGEKIRVCADFSTGLTATLDIHVYPPPHPDELFTKLNGG